MVFPILLSYLYEGFVMEKYYGTLILAGCPVNIMFHFWQNMEHCGKFLARTIGKGSFVSAEEYEKEAYYHTFPDREWDIDAENKAMICLASDALLPYNRMIFHSVAFFYNGQAFLMTAPSGVGKSTQYKNLKELYGDDVQIMSGDNPVLHFLENGIMVHPSPWNGKENYGSMLVAPLGGIVCLKQAGFNRISKLTSNEAVVPIFHGMNTYSRNETLVRKLLKLEEKLITSVPVYQLENKGNLESSALLMETIRKEVCHEI